MIPGAVSRRQLRAQRDEARAEADEVKRQLAAVKHQAAKTAGDLREVQDGFRQLEAQHKVVQRIAWDHLDRRCERVKQVDRLQSERDRLRGALATIRGWCRRFDERVNLRWTVDTVARNALYPPERALEHDGASRPV